MYGVLLVLIRQCEAVEEDYEERSGEEALLENVTNLLQRIRTVIDADEQIR